MSWHREILTSEPGWVLNMLTHVRLYCVARWVATHVPEENAPSVSQAYNDKVVVVVVVVVVCGSYDDASKMHFYPPLIRVRTCPPPKAYFCPDVPQNRICLSHHYQQSIPRVALNSFFQSATLSLPILPAPSSPRSCSTCRGEAVGRGDICIGRYLPIVATTRYPIILPTSSTLNALHASQLDTVLAASLTRERTCQTPCKPSSQRAQCLSLQAVLTMGCHRKPEIDTPSPPPQPPNSLNKPMLLKWEPPNSLAAL